MQARDQYTVMNIYEKDSKKDEPQLPFKLNLWPLFEIEWHRVILDEAHEIRNATTKTSPACVTLRKMFGYCLTATPIQVRSHLLHSPQISYLIPF